MDRVALFDLATHQANWLSARQAAVASNIANVNTPKYRSRDVAPFDAVLSARTVSMAQTETGHVGPVSGDSGIRTVEDGRRALTPGGSNVVFEDELARSSDIRAAHELNIAVVRSFHRMMLQVARP